MLSTHHQELIKYKSIDLIKIPKYMDRIQIIILIFFKISRPKRKLFLLKQNCQPILV
jgi:hypothetical protein